MTTTGVLYVQLGTPDSPSTADVRRYLREFLSDPRVVDLPPWKWKPILNGIVLRTRPRRSAAAYRNVWTEDGSPLLVHSQQLVEHVAAVLGEGYTVELGMRIGNPNMKAALDRLVAAGCRRVVVVPLFPQYSCATTASVFDALGEWALGKRDVPAFHVVRGFAVHPRFIRGLCETVQATGRILSNDAPLLMSFHGLPQRFVDEGDSYASECEATALALARALGLARDSWHLTYQSKFGREQWLTPSTEETLVRLAEDGVKDVTVVSPSFFADCLETIDEIGRELREVFQEAGGETLTRVACLNASDAAVETAVELALAGLHGAPCVLSQACDCTEGCAWIPGA